MSDSMTEISAFDVIPSPTTPCCPEISWDASEGDIDKMIEFETSLPRRSERYWFDDGTVVVQVENTLYKLYKGILIRQSDYFRTNITAALELTTTGKKRGRYGPFGPPRLVGIGSEDHPLVLQVKKVEFELLLSYLLPENYSSQYSFTTKEWSAIAKVSKKLELNSVTGAAVTNILRTADAVDLVDIGPKYNLPECYLEGFRRLSIRDASLSLEEGQRLGLATVITIAHARDMLAKGSEWAELEFSVQFEVAKMKVPIR